jgi:hypothetical protein
LLPKKEEEEERKKRPLSAGYKLKSHRSQANMNGFPNKGERKPKTTLGGKTEGPWEFVQ